MRHLNKIAPALLCVALLSGLFSGSACAAAGKVVVAPLSGAVDERMEESVRAALAQAAEEKAGLVVFRLDASEGSVEAARGIARTILNSPVPVAVWAPPGKRVEAAEVFLMQAAHIAAMAQDTSIGAAPSAPVSGDVASGDAKQAVSGDLKAHLRALAQRRGRNTATVPETIGTGRSLTAREAFDEGIIDIVADDIDVLVSASLGRSVEVDGKRTRVNASADQVENLEISAPVVSALTGKVIVSPLSGTVSVQMEEFIGKVVARAEEENAGLIVFRLDTPGGLVSATQGINQAILNSRVPVAMWVPKGGRAASAGAFMMQAAHIAAMAEGSNIGAASPVEITGGDIVSGDMRDKVINDLKAQMRSLTQMHGRNTEIAQEMIEKARSLSSREAFQEGVIDFIANSPEELIAKAQGRVVSVDGRRVEIRASADMIQTVEMSLQERLIQFLSDPSIAYLLLVGGMLAIFYEIITPGGFVLGVTGAVMLLLGSIGLKMLPFNWAGVALIGAGVIVMGIDLLVGGMGILSLLGIAVLIVGGLFLFRTPGGELLHVSMSVMAGMAITLGLCFTFFALMIARSLRSKVTTGLQGMVGLEVEITEDLNPEGMVRCHGELWKARTGGEDLTKGTPAVVTATEGIVLVVKEKKHFK